jgi:hypothetical protein
MEGVHVTKRCLAILLLEGERLRIINLVRKVQAVAGEVRDHVVYTKECVRQVWHYFKYRRYRAIIRAFYAGVRDVCIILASWGLICYL